MAPISSLPFTIGSTSRNWFEEEINKTTKIVDIDEAIYRNWFQTVRYNRSIPKSILKTKKRIGRLKNRYLKGV
jgi:hypothetical protein